MISPLFSLCYIHFLQSLFKKTGLLFFKKICSISVRIIQKAMVDSFLEFTDQPYGSQNSIFYLSFKRITTTQRCHCVKSVRIRSYSGPHFSTFGLNTERYSISLCIQSECGKYRPEYFL